jgi:hypothetical protein
VRWIVVAVVPMLGAPLAYAEIRPTTTAQVTPTQAHDCPAAPHAHRPARPPQFDVVSFDGSGGTGLWRSIPLLEIPFVGHGFRVVSVDYNFFADQAGVADPGRETTERKAEAFAAAGLS